MDLPVPSEAVTNVLSMPNSPYTLLYSRPMSTRTLKRNFKRLDFTEFYSAEAKAQLYSTMRTKAQKRLSNSARRLHQQSRPARLTPRRPRLPIPLHEVGRFQNSRANSSREAAQPTLRQQPPIALKSQRVLKAARAQQQLLPGAWLNVQKLMQLA